jgi:hypothetical protein
MNTQSADGNQPCITSAFHQPTENIPYGNLIQTKHPNTFRLYLQNVNGVYKGNSWDDWKSLK